MTIRADVIEAVERLDGHDAGFLCTDEPRKTFTAIQGILGSRDFWIDARVAYRDANGEDFTVLWPKGLTSFYAG